MRPLRFLLLLTLFVVLPIILTCVSLFSSTRSDPETVRFGFQPPTSPFRSLFSFSTPSSLFPPSAIIGLYNDNTTGFYARPATFGPSLPRRGLTGQLWIGKGFGEDTSLSDEELKYCGFELGCSDVPGWSVDLKRNPDGGLIDERPVLTGDGDFAIRTDALSPSNPSKRDGVPTNELLGALSDRDGTDDYLHRPLPDSVPASKEKPGEPASNSKPVKGQKSVHADIESLQESADIAGKVVMLSRGGCGFLEKVKWAQRRGAIAVIVGDNEPGGQLIIMNADHDTSNVTIPAIFTSYYSAEMLASLVPADDKSVADGKTAITQSKKGKASRKGKPGSDRSSDVKSARLKGSKPDSAHGEKGWVRNMLSAVGLNNDAGERSEDSRRPPGSGNIDWVLKEEWIEDRPVTVSTSTQTQRTATVPGRGVKSLSTATKKAGNDDFIIGVQDWRDTELIAPKTTSTQKSKKQKGKAETTALQTSTSTSSVSPLATALGGGIITPGSGEYDYQRERVSGKESASGMQPSKSDEHADHGHRLSFSGGLASYFRSGSDKEAAGSPSTQDTPARVNKPGEGDAGTPGQEGKEHSGLWVTLYPSSPSTSPFFDTLLVLVVSPLMTLTFVYGLLLLRSRIRRRRWRAPKSIVERLPVRTYQTMSTTSSTTSLAFMPPQSSSSNSPSFGPDSHHHHHHIRPRSQTTTGVLTSSTPTEKSALRSSPKRKRYTGRQVECVVCLEEYVDGESQVMSLPCGHEFHVDCITPWLVTRRRTCPICKGDVVRSFAKAAHDPFCDSEDGVDEDERTSDDVQERAIMTTNTPGSAAIPIPVAADTASADDIERGSDVETPLLGATPRVQQGRWHSILTGSWNRLSGDTVWRSSSGDRTR